MKYKNVGCAILLALCLAACSSESATSTPTMQPTLPMSPTSQLQPTLPPMPPTPTAPVPTIDLTQMSIATPTPSLTPSPTLSVEEVDQLQLNWRQELETRVGFSHPIFETIAGNLPSNSTYFRRDVEPVVVQTTFEDVGYTAIVVDVSQGIPFRSFLLFSIVDQEAELIFSTGGESVGFNHFDNNGEDISGFADRNGNGYPDITVEVACICSQGWSYLKILEVHSASEVLDLTPQVSNVRQQQFTDVNNDGVLEIRMFEISGAPRELFKCCALYLIRYFGWDGTAYQDISETLPELYYPSIVANQKYIRNIGSCLTPSGSMYEILVNYYAMGRLREGWAWLEPRLAVNTCNSNDTFSYQIDDLYKWVNIRLAEENQRRLTSS